MASEMKENQIPIEDLPVTLEAFEDKNGFALVISSKDERIGDSNGRLVNNFLVRIARGDIPKVGTVHSVKISDKGHERSVEVADINMDESGKLFVKSNIDGIQRPINQN